MAKTNKLCFSNGTSAENWLEHNCEGNPPCIKRQRVHRDGSGPFYCTIQRDICLQWFGSTEINEKTYNATQVWNCPYKQTTPPKRKQKTKVDNQPNLFELLT